MHSTVKLWTFQHIKVVEILKQEGVFRPEWDRVAWPFARYCYPWMIREMARRRIDCGDRPPVWAWHSCGGRWGGPPTLGDAVALLGGLPEQMTIEFEAPAEIVLLSSYGEWNRLTHLLTPENWERKRYRRLFNTQKTDLKQDSIQACLPVVRWDWVRDVRPLLSFGMEDFPPESRNSELV